LAKLRSKKVKGKRMEKTLVATVEIEQGTKRETQQWIGTEMIRQETVEIADAKCINQYWISASRSQVI
jgi:hypothetical protein